MKKILQAVAFAAAILSTAAQATPFATDTSDVWYNPNESGWGLTIAQQNDTLFAVLYLYGSGNTATWYVAPDMPFSGVSASGTTYTGTLYQTTGSPYTQTFNSASVTTRAVGTATFTLTNLTTGTIAYSIDNVATVKSVTRLTWLANTLSGNFMGGRVGTVSNCPAGGDNGYREEPGVWTVQHDNNGVQMAFASATGTCTFSGPYAQGGHFGFVTGNYMCSNGTSGSFQAFELNSQITALSGRLTSTASNGCTYEGRVGGVRRTP